VSALLSSPSRVYRIVATAEAVTWAGLLSGMFLKYVTETTELGVSIFGMLHGIVFITYCVTTIVIAIDQRWSLGRLVAGLASSIPPFLTLWFERYAERRGLLAPTWRLVDESPTRPLERPLAWLLRNPVRGLAAGLASVAALTVVALIAGPPVG
jgi:integral membrane protein